MADDTAPPPVDLDQIQQAIARLGLTPPTQAPVSTADGPGAHGFAGFIGDVGNVLGGGGSGLLGLGPDEQAAAGRRALMAAGVNMLISGGPSYYPKNFGSVLGHGLEAAMQSRDQSERDVFVAHGSQQQLAQQAFQNRLSAIKEALPLLTLQQRASLGNPFAQGGGKPSTSITAANEGGATIGQRQNNPGNLTFAGQPYASPGQGNRFASFPDMATGVAANADQLALYQTQHGISTVRDAVTKWVSDPKADLTSYIADVAKAVGVGPDDKIDLTDPVVQQKFIQAQFPHESAGGGYKLDPAVVQKGVQMAAARRGKVVQEPPSQVAAAPKPPAAASAAAPAPKPVQVATATPQSQTDATPAPVAPAVVPGQPRDITALKDEELSLPEFQQRYRTPLAPDAGTVKVNPQVLTDRQAAVGAAQQAVTQAQQGMRAAEQDWTVQRDDKSLQARSAAQQRLETAQQNLQTAQQNANKLTQDAETESVKNRQAAQQAQDQQLAANYKDLKDRQAQAALETQRGQQQLAQTTAQGEQQRLSNKEAVVNAANQKGFDQAVADQHAARNVRTQVQGFRALSDALEQPGWIQTTKFPGSEQTIAEKLQQTGVVKLDDTSAVQLLRGGITNLTRTLREGLPMGALSDRDLSFIERMGPTEWMDKDTRTAAAAYLEQAFAAKEKYASIVQKEMARGKNYADAADEADRQVKPFVPTVPNDLAQHWTDQTPEWKAARTKWAADNNVRPGSLYDFPDGRLVLAKKPATTAPALAVPR